MAPIISANTAATPLAGGFAGAGTLAWGSASGASKSTSGTPSATGMVLPALATATCGHSCSKRGSAPST
jgi:hypothetical protein